MHQPEVTGDPVKLRGLYDEALQLQKNLIELTLLKKDVSILMLLQINSKLLAPLISKLQPLRAYAETPDVQQADADKIKCKRFETRADLIRKRLAKNSGSDETCQQELYEDALTLQKELIESGLLESQVAETARAAAKLNLTVAFQQEDIKTNQVQHPYLGPTGQASVQLQAVAAPPDVQQATENTQLALLKVKFDYINRCLIQDSAQQEVRQKELYGEVLKLNIELVQSGLLQSQVTEIQESASEMLESLNELEIDLLGKINSQTPAVSSAVGPGMRATTKAAPADDTLLDDIRNNVGAITKALQQPEVKCDPVKLTEFYDEALTLQKKLIALGLTPGGDDGMMQLPSLNVTDLGNLILKLQPLQAYPKTYDVQQAAAEELKYKCFETLANLIENDWGQKSGLDQIRQQERYNDALKLQNELITSGLLKSQVAETAQAAAQLNNTVAILGLHIKMQSHCQQLASQRKQASMQPQPVVAPPDEEQAAAERMQLAVFEVQLDCMNRDSGRGSAQQKDRQKELYSEVLELDIKLVQSGLLQSQVTEIKQRARDILIGLTSLKINFLEKINSQPPAVSSAVYAGMWARKDAAPEDAAPEDAAPEDAASAGAAAQRLQG